MNMVGHNHEHWDFHIILANNRRLFDLFRRPFPYFRQFHPTINHITKIQIMVFRAKGHEIPSAIVIVPCGTR
jgi:hypothetical protein